MIDSPDNSAKSKALLQEEQLMMPMPMPKNESWHAMQASKDVGEPKADDLNWLVGDLNWLVGEEYDDESKRIREESCTGVR
jgi:hypothetical protein